MEENPRMVRNSNELDEIDKYQHSEELLVHHPGLETQSGNNMGEAGHSEQAVSRQSHKKQVKCDNYTGREHNLK